MPALKASTIREQTPQQLITKLDELKTELASLRVAQVTGGNASRLAKIHGIRKSIARVLTVLNQRRKLELRGVLKKKKYLPLDLRTKKTRAIRRRLTKQEDSLTTARAHKKLVHFPLRKYAVKA